MSPTEYMGNLVLLIVGNESDTAQLDDRQGCWH